MIEYGMTIQVVIKAEDADKAYINVRDALKDIGASVELQDGPDELGEL